MGNSPYLRRFLVLTCFYNPVLYRNFSERVKDKQRTMLWSYSCYYHFKLRNIFLNTVNPIMIKHNGGNTMSRYKSEQTAYNPLKKKYVPLWKLDTNTVTVTYFNADTQTEKIKTYHTDFIRYHLHFSDSHCPDRLRKLVNEGRIIQYLDDMERKVSEAISRQVELWKQTDSCYQKAVLSGDTEKMLGLENCFVYMAREAVFECMVYI